jgi:Na+-driven multidrug efflux pump
MEQNNKIKIFEEYSVPKAFLSLVVPTIISQIIIIIYNYADTWFLGRTNNADAVAAINVVMPIFIIMNALANLFGIGGSSLIARYLGRKDPDKAKHVFAFSLWGSVAASIIYSLVILIFAKPISLASL